MMMLLCAFDLPRLTKEERKIATQYQKKLVELGFSMKQFSVYERPIRQSSARNRIIEILKKELPETGAITLYILPDDVNDSQITILGKKSIIKSFKEARIIFF